MRKIVAASVTLTGLGLLSSSAHAGGIATARFGGEHGHPMTNEPTAIYYNPAGIARSDGINIFLDGTLALRGVYYAHDQMAGETDEPPDAVGANFGENHLFNFVAAPMIGTSLKVDFDDWGLAWGAGFYVPFGGSSVWGKVDKWKDNAPYPGIQDGVARWYSIDGTIRSFYITGTMAVEIMDMVYLGVSGNAVMSEINTIRARNVNDTNEIVAGDPYDPNAGPFEGRSWLQGTSWNGSLGFGVQVMPIPNELLFGLSYQTRPGIAGGFDLEGKLKQNFAGRLTDDEIRLHEDMPDIFLLGVAYRPQEDLELRLFGNWQRWSALERMCIVGKLPNGEWSDCELDDDGSYAGAGAPDPNQVNIVQNLPRDWNDTFGIRFGVSYWVTPEIELMPGIGYDSNAIPDELMDPALIDFHDIMLAFGARFEIAEWLYAGATFMQFIYFPRDTREEAAQQDYPSPSTGPNGGGIYEQWISALDLNLQATFDPF